MCVPFLLIVDYANMVWVSVFCHKIDEICIFFCRFLISRDMNTVLLVQNWHRFNRKNVLLHHNFFKGLLTICRHFFLSETDYKKISLRKWWQKVVPEYTIWVQKWWKIAALWLLALTTCDRWHATCARWQWYMTPDMWHIIYHYLLLFWIKTFSFKYIILFASFLLSAHI